MTGFGGAIRDNIFLLKDEKVKTLRVLNIWLERNVYEDSFIDELKSIVSGSVCEAPGTTKILAEFKLATLVRPIEDIKKLEDDAKLAVGRINSERIQALTHEVLNNLKDKSHGEQFSKEYDEAEKLLDTEIKVLEKEVSSRAKLLEELDKALIFYETQKEEVRVIANSYKNCYKHITNVKKQLGKSSSSLPSPLPSPDVNAPSPTNSDDGFQFPQMSSNASQDQNHTSSLDQRLSTFMQGMIGGAAPGASGAQGIPPFGSIAPTSSIPLPSALHNALHMSIDNQVQSSASSGYFLQHPPPPPPPQPPFQMHSQMGYPQSENAFGFGNQHQYPPASLSTHQDAFHQIQSVVSSRTEESTDNADRIRRLQQFSQYPNQSNTHPNENFEPADMDLGNSDDEDHRVFMPRLSNNNLKVIEPQAHHHRNGPYSNGQSNPYGSTQPYNPAEIAPTNMGDADWRANARGPRAATMPRQGYHQQNPEEFQPSNSHSQQNRKSRYSNQEPMRPGHRDGYSRY